VYNNLPSYVGAGSQSDPFINPLTMHFVAGIAGQLSEGNESDPWRPDWVAKRKVTYGVVDFHVFPNGTLYVHLYGQDRTTGDEVWAQKVPGCVTGCVHGTCAAFSKCICDEGWIGHDCSIFKVSEHLVAGTHS
jgi:hypothetical protein